MKISNVKDFLTTWYGYKQSIDNGSVNENEIQEKFTELQHGIEKKINTLSNRYNSWVKDLLALYEYFKDPQAGLYEKIGIILVFIYVINPMDMVPDYIPILGYIDDGLIISLLVKKLGEKIHVYKQGP